MDVDKNMLLSAIESNLARYKEGVLEVNEIYLILRIIDCMIEK